jgi:hypothetical protein
MDHVRDAEEVHLEQSADLVLLAFFHGCEIADAGIVHEDVDALERLLCRLDGRVGLRAIRNVQRKDERLAARFEVFNLVRLARGHHDPVSEVEQMGRDVPSKACGASGDEPHGCMMLCHQ